MHIYIDVGIVNICQVYLENICGIWLLSKNVLASPWSKSPPNWFPCIYSYPQRFITVIIVIMLRSQSISFICLKYSKSKESQSPCSASRPRFRFCYLYVLLSHCFIHTDSLLLGGTQPSWECSWYLMMHPSPLQAFTQISPFHQVSQTMTSSNLHIPLPLYFSPIYQTPSSVQHHLLYLIYFLCSVPVDISFIRAGISIGDFYILPGI